MGKVFEGMMDARGKKFGLVVSRFNDFITRKLLDGATDSLMRHGADDKNIEVAFVPGSFEIPSVAKKMAKSNRYDAVICLGSVIKGDTPHFDYIASEVSKGVAQLSLESEVPVIFGVITADSLEQAIERAGTKQGNKGKDAADTAIEMANLYENLVK